MQVALGIAIALLLVAAVAIALLLRRLGLLAAERDAARDAAEEARARIEHHRLAAADLDKQLAVLRARSEDDSRRIDEFKQQIDTHLKALAGEALRGSSEQFLNLAKQVFEREQEKAGKNLDANRAAIESLVKPVADSLDKYQKALGEAEQQRNKALGSLTEQARALSDDHRRLREETANLVKALRRPDVRGQWGEMQLKRLFELAGMAERVDYHLQSTVRDDDGDALRPDATVRLPNDRTIVIDVKTPLAAYLDYTETTDDAERARHLDRHASQFKQKVKELTSKRYWAACDGSPEFVVMFVPGESMLYAALQSEPDLIDRAMEDSVIIATPTVLLALLKTVAMGWREKRLEENARHIAEIGAQLHKRIAKVLEEFAKLGRNLNTTLSTYNTLVASIDTRLLPTARKLEEADAASPKSLPDSLETIVEIPRELRSLPTADSPR